MHHSQKKKKKEQRPEDEDKEEPEQAPKKSKASSPKPIKGKLWADEVSDVETASVSSYMEDNDPMEEDCNQQDLAEERYKQFFQLYLEVNNIVQYGIPNL